MDALERDIEAWREALNVPGVAVAVVKEGETVLSRGFGLRDVSGGLPVTERTLFAIGSATKAFTATLIGALVDDGLLEWDRPVADYLPGFRMHDPVATELLTPRDLLSHRSGLPRHDLLWYGDTDLSAADVVARLRHLEPNKTFRQVWQYNNLMFITAGHLAATVLGTDWREALRRRLLEPLGMTDTNLTIGEAEAAADCARPYVERNGEWREVPWRDLRLGGPAGAINSCIADMARWAEVNVNGGSVGDRRVISPAALKELHAPTMVMPEGGDVFPEVKGGAYALGWFLGNYRGHKYVHHGGNIDGFSSMVAFLPSQHVSVVVLTNMQGTYLRDAVPFRVFDEFLGLEPLPWGDRFKAVTEAMKQGLQSAREHVGARSSKAPMTHPLEDYPGTYTHPGYGDLRIYLEDGRLRSDYHNLDLVATHRHYDTFEVELDVLDARVPISFQLDQDGNVSALSAPLEPAVPPIVFTRKADAVDAKLLSLLAGDYTMGPITIPVEARDGRLFAEIIGQGKVELEPYRGTTFSVVGQPSVKLEFVMDGDSVQKVVIPGMAVLERVG